jgi:hypothetical protein
MKGQSLVPKKKRGPPATGQGVQIQVRFQPDKLLILDKWIAKQDDTLSRPEAIRRLVDLAFALDPSIGSAKDGYKRKAV